MSDKPILLFLHGVGDGDPEDHWQETLQDSLVGLGYPGLDDIEVIVPKYPIALRHGDDEKYPLPEITVKAPTGEESRENYRAFERRTAALEVLLGGHDPGGHIAGTESVVDTALNTPVVFRRARNYLRNRDIRGLVLTKILDKLPQSGRIVIVAHSLGSVIAADLIQRLPVGLEIQGVVTIGSPLGNPNFNTGPLQDGLRQPPTNLSWWVNFWNSFDPVTAIRGLSSVFRWVLDLRVSGTFDIHVHSASTYLENDRVACAIGYALYGSLSKELAVAPKGADIPLDPLETWVLLALRYGHLTNTKLDGEQKNRFSDALRRVQATTFSQVKERNERMNRALPNAIAELAVDLLDPTSVAKSPEQISHISKEDAVVALVSIATSNVVQPYEIAVTKEISREALEDLSIESGLGRQFGRDVFEALAEADKALLGNTTNWIKWASLGVGAVALVAATGGLALAAAPGLAGAAAITSALAAFGPGGMVGGLLTAGTLVSAGGGSLAIGLSSPTTSAEAVEAATKTQLAAAILRKKQELAQDPATWLGISDTGIQLRREQSQLGAISDRSADTLKELEKKLKTVDRALAYLTKEGLGPDHLDDPDGADMGSPTEFFDKAIDAFRPIDIDGDGIPDKSRAAIKVEETGSAIREKATEAAEKFGSLFRRRGEQD